MRLRGAAPEIDQETLLDLAEATLVAHSPEIPAKTARYVGWFLKAGWRYRAVAMLFDLNPDSVLLLQAKMRRAA